MIKRKPNRTKKPAPKKPSRSKIVQKLDTVFSLYIRYKNSKNGFCTCVTCGRKYEIKKIQNGHFMSRKHYSTRWDEMNCGPQCFGCNVAGQGQQFLYAKYIDQKYGEGTSDMLLQKSREIVKFSTHELEDMIEYYQKELNKLK